MINRVSSTASYACVYGGAIGNCGTSSYQAVIGDITGDFIGNYASGYSAYGGAIYNSDATIGDITGDFVGNWAQKRSKP